jgi:hypothetical protein
MLKNQKANIKIEIDDNRQKNDLINYKGQFFNENVDTKYYEHGAHFQYKDLCKRLDNLLSTMSPSRRGKQSKDEVEIKEIKPKKIVIKQSKFKAHDERAGENIIEKRTDNRIDEVILGADPIKSNRVNNKITGKTLQYSLKHPINIDRFSPKILKIKSKVKINPSIIQNKKEVERTNLASYSKILSNDVSKTERNKVLPVINKTRNLALHQNYKTNNLQSYSFDIKKTTSVEPNYYGTINFKSNYT